MYVAGISNNGANGAAMHRTESLDDDFYTQAMSLLCPLDDEHLPMEASNLKNKQVEVALLQLKDHTLNAESHTVRCVGYLCLLVTATRSSCRLETTVFLTDQYTLAYCMT